MQFDSFISCNLVSNYDLSSYFKMEKIFNNKYANEKYLTFNIKRLIVLLIKIQLKEY